jgi:hypothetical protein
MSMSTFTFKGAHWSEEYVDEWLVLWSKLWKLGVKWEWHRGDSMCYTGPDRRVFRLAQDAGPWSVYRLGDPVPLPSWSVIQDMAEWVHDKDRSLYERLLNFSYNLVPDNVFE